MPPSMASAMNGVCSQSAAHHPANPPPPPPTNTNTPNTQTHNTTSSHRSSHRSMHGSKNPDHKPTRVRTVLNEKQLHTLRSCYNANPRPDALMKEQLVEMTGLSPRVIRVWYVSLSITHSNRQTNRQTNKPFTNNPSIDRFQNKRCKDKKRSILMKQMQQQEKVSVISIPLLLHQYTFNAEQQKKE